MANLKISAMTAGTAPTGAELVPVVQGGNSRSLTTAQIAGLASDITGTDYDIGTGNETADISTLTATVGSSARYSWYDGDGTYTFSFTGTAGITIDGIAASEYVGEGVGHLDLYVVSASACVTINRGEIWDNDGGNHTQGAFSKKLDGQLFQAGIDSDSVSAASEKQITITYPISNADTTYILLSQATAIVGGGAWFPYAESSKAVGSIILTYTDYVPTARTGTLNIKWSVNGRWTTNYPRIAV